MLETVPRRHRPRWPGAASRLPGEGGFGVVLGRRALAPPAGCRPGWAGHRAAGRRPPLRPRRSVVGARPSRKPAGEGAGRWGTGSVGPAARDRTALPVRRSGLRRADRGQGVVMPDYRTIPRPATIRAKLAQAPGVARVPEPPARPAALVTTHDAAATAPRRAAPPRWPPPRSGGCWPPAAPAWRARATAPSSCSATPGRCAAPSWSRCGGSTSRSPPRGCACPSRAARPTRPGRGPSSASPGAPGPRPARCARSRPGCAPPTAGTGRCSARWGAGAPSSGRRSRRRAWPRCWGASPRRRG